jgi:hypothetical protein
MLRQLQEWSRRRAEEKRARNAAWVEAERVGDDGLTNFERDAIAALTPITGTLLLNRAAAGMPYLFGPIPATPMTLYLYADEAQVHGIEPAYRRERWDFSSPQESISDLVGYVHEALQPNNSFERTRGR